MSYQYSNKIDNEEFTTNDYINKYPEYYKKTLVKPRKYALTGTSFAAPAFVSLMAEALCENSDKKLTKHDLIDMAMFVAEAPFTPRLKDGWQDKKFSDYVRTFSSNKSHAKNGTAYAHSLEFGFGIVDRKQYLRLAKDWVKKQNFDLKEIEISVSNEEKSADGNFIYTFNVTQDCQIQQIQINYKGIDQSSWGFFTTNKYSEGDLAQLHITSPQGTTRAIHNDLLSAKTSQNKLSEDSQIDADVKNAFQKVFASPLAGLSKSVQFWGEQQTKGGQWKITSNCQLDQTKTKLKIIANFSKDDRYYYSNDIVNVANPEPLADTNGGDDVVYFTNYDLGKVVVDKAKDEIRFYKNYTVAKTIKLGSSDTIEKFIFGSQGGQIIPK